MPVPGSLQALNEEEIFDTQFQRELYPMGWIHTHPTQVRRACTVRQSGMPCVQRGRDSVALVTWRHAAVAIVIDPQDAPLVQR